MIKQLNVAFIKQSLFSETGMLLLTTVSGYAFAYLYLVIMGRTLGPEQFGILGALFAIFYIACLVGQALREGIATNVAEIKTKAGEEAAVSVFKKLAVKLGLLCLIPTAAFLAAAQPIAVFFHVGSVVPVVILGFSLFTALLLDIVLGLLQGLQRFRELGLAGYTLSQGLKLVFGVGLVLAGTGLSGAVVALLVSTTVATIAGFVFIRKRITESTGTSAAKSTPRLSPVLVPALILAVFMAMPTSVDVMLVTHYFGGRDAGLYNAVATLGRVVIFLPMAASFVLLPKATEDHSMGQNTRKILMQSLLYALVLSGGVAVFCWLFPSFIVKIFFGGEYADAGGFIGLYVTAMVLFSLDFVLVHYALAIRNFRLMLFADMVTVLEIAAIIFVHQTLFQVLWILLLGNAAILLFGFSYFALRRNRQDAHSLKGKKIG